MDGDFHTKGSFRFCGKEYLIVLASARTAKTRCYKCAFYALWCADKRKSGYIPECDPEKRIDGLAVCFLRE